MEVKKPEYYCKQVNLLIEHGCKVDDFEQAIMILSKINYYKLSAYFLPFKNEDGSYIEGTSIVKVYKIYEFDRKLSNLLYGVIQKIEVFIKTQIAYYHSNKYGALGYLDPNNMRENANMRHCKLIERFDQEVKRNKDLLFVKHHIEKYDGKFPLWVAVELFSMGNISQFYSQLKTSDQKVIAKMISCVTNNNCTYSQIASCLKCLTDLRNKCAHFGRIYYTIFSSTPNLPCKEAEKAFVLGNKYIYLYSYLYVLKVLYPSQDTWISVLTDLLSLIDEYSEYIDIKHIGFPNDWYGLLK